MKFLKSIKITFFVFIESLKRKKTIEQDFDLGNNIKLFYWKYSDKKENLGDFLSKVVVNNFVSQIKGKNNNTKSRTLYAIGSILGFRCQNAVVWGSGILYPSKKRLKRIKFSSLDVRAVRGPKTRQHLLGVGKKCPEIYGDPAILMPKIFNPNITEKIYPISLIMHYNDTFEIPNDMNINVINILTTDYKDFIIQILQSSLVISSSLHGIILSETYGIPAVLLQKDNQSLFKFEDYYNSTGRYNVLVAKSIQEAIKLQPMPIPDLSLMQENLLNAFPSDLWN